MIEGDAIVMIMTLTIFIESNKAMKTWREKLHKKTPCDHANTFNLSYNRIHITYCKAFISIIYCSNHICEAKRMKIKS